MDVDIVRHRIYVTDPTEYARAKGKLTQGGKNKQRCVLVKSYGARGGRKGNSQALSNAGK